MSLTFGAATSDRVNCGTLNGYNNETFTALQWVYPTTLTNARAFFAKSNGIAQMRLLVGTVTSELSFAWTGAVADSYISSGAGLTINKWWFVGIVVDHPAAAGSRVKLYLGDESAQVVLLANGTATDGNTFASMAAITWCWGNRENAINAFQGDIFWSGLWDRALTIGEIEDQRKFLHVTANNLLFCPFTNDTVGTQYDQSGNQFNGTVTGATVSTRANPVGVKFDHLSPRRVAE